MRESGSGKVRGRCDKSHIFSLFCRQIVVNFRPDSLVRPRRRAGVTHNVLAPRSFRSEVFWHGRSGPCCLSFGFTTIPLRIVPSPSFCRARRLGSHRLWYFWAGIVRSARVLLLGLYRALGVVRSAERARASADEGGVCLSALTISFGTVSRERNPQFDHATMSGLGSFQLAEEPSIFPHCS